MKKYKNETAIFLIILTILSTILYLFIFSQESFMNSKVLGVIFMWLPGITGILTLFITKARLSSIGWRLGKIKYLVIGYLLLLVCILTVYILGSVFNLIKFHPEKITQQIFIMLFFGPIINIIGVLGEEIGWRGVLLPTLNRKVGYTRTSFIIGLVWSVWHFPLILFTDFYSGEYVWIALIGFTVFTVSITFAYNWLWLASGSIWTVSLLHAVGNFYSLNIVLVFEPIHKLANILVSDCGLGVSLLSILIGFIFWKLKNRLPVAESK